MRRIILHDVLSYNLGIMIESGGHKYMRPMLKKNATIPTEFEHEFFTQQDYQQRIDVTVLQGMHELAEDNH